MTGSNLSLLEHTIDRWKVRRGGRDCFIKPLGEKVKNSHKIKKYIKNMAEVENKVDRDEVGVERQKYEV